jgi:hypothetical protein
MRLGSDELRAPTPKRRRRGLQRIQRIADDETEKDQHREKRKVQRVQKHAQRERESEHIRHSLAVIEIVHCDCARKYAIRDDEQSETVARFVAFDGAFGIRGAEMKETEVELRGQEIQQKCVVCEQREPREKVAEREARKGDEQSGRHSECGVGVEAKVAVQPRHCH